MGDEIRVSLGRYCLLVNTQQNQVMVDKADAKRSSSYFLYLLLCGNAKIYTGITTDVQKRFEAHLAGRGAKFTRSHTPHKLLCSAPVGDRSNAQRIEYEVKQLPRAKKIAFVKALAEHV